MSRDLIWDIKPHIGALVVEKLRVDKKYPDPKYVYTANTYMEMNKTPIFS